MYQLLVQLKNKNISFFFIVLLIGRDKIFVRVNSQVVLVLVYQNRFLKVVTNEKGGAVGDVLSPNHYMLVGEVVLDVFFVILMGCHLV
jgi:hypothetical protein